MSTSSLSFTDFGALDIGRIASSAGLSRCSSFKRTLLAS
jgi:hypothetical protein